MNILSQQQVDFFNENGFLRIPGVFDADEVAWLSDELERLMEEWAIEGPGWRGPWREVYMTAEEDEKSILTAMHDLQLYSEAYQRAVVNDTLTGAIADILGPNIELHHSTLHAKAPETGTPFPMHQDYPFYQHEGPAFIDAIIHIDAATEENGCLKFLAGSHKLGPLQHIRGEAGHNLPTDVYRLEDAVSVPADAGDVVLFSYQTVHGSSLNRTDRWRRLVRVGYRDPDNFQIAGQSFGRPGVIVRGQKRNRGLEDPLARERAAQMAQA